MSARTVARMRRRLSVLPNVLGLGLITLAPVNNFVLASMTVQEIEALPALISIPYLMAGPVGVTMILVTSGLLAILLGLILQMRAARIDRPVVGAQYAGGYIDLFHTDQGPSGSSMRLETERYLNHWTPTEPIPAPEAAMTELALPAEPETGAEAVSVAEAEPISEEEAA